MNKLDEFKRRSRHRNPHLYSDSSIEGYDYVICPVSNCRMSMIKNNYITNVLGMTVESYDEQHPNIEKNCKKRIENISNGLQQLDNATGKTKYQLSQEKAKNVLNKIGDDGLTGYARKGQKTRATHLANIDALGRNGYSALATKAIIKGNNTKVQRGTIVPPAQKKFLGRYRTVVQYLTNKHKQQLIEGYKTGLAGTIDAWHLDHKYSIQAGFKNKISPLIIGHIQNLEMIPWRSNISKSSTCSITEEDLLLLTGYTQEKSMFEFNIVMDFIYQDDIMGISPNGAFLLERLYAAILPK